jgi:hypothetical protein
LVSSGFSSEPIPEGVDVSGWYVREGTPPANYTEKSSEFDIWNTETRKWDVNPNQAALEAALEEEMRNRDKQKLVMTVLTERKAKLVASDWTQLADIPAETKALWEPYRQALRDVTDQPGYPYDIVWPTPPQ